MQTQSNSIQPNQVDSTYDVFTNPHIANETNGYLSRKGGRQTETHCKYGHAMTPDNIYMNKDTGGRICKTCKLESLRRRKYRQKEKGVPTGVNDALITAKIEARFWSKVDKKPSGCWEWLGHRNEKGYGHFAIVGQYPRAAHRVAYRLANGHFDDSLFVCHRCDNPSCVNPDHLFLGTQQDNMDDMVQKGRSCDRTGRIAQANKEYLLRYNSGQVKRTHCKHGHEFTPQNTGFETKAPTRPPSRYCKTCRLLKEATPKVE